MRFLQVMQPYAAKVSQWRRDIHAHPEIGFELPRTSGKVAELLESFGLEIQRDFVPSAVLGILRTGRPGPVVAMRADMDALSMEDVKDVPYRSQVKGRCHACGHDAHTSLLLGLANFCADHKELFKGTIKFVFQPAEEGPAPGGAKLICESGVLDDVDYMIGAHAQPLYKAGQVGMRHDEDFASGDFFEIRVTGKSCHGASPHMGTDCLAAAGELVCALQSIRSREVPPLKPAVLSVTSIAGGDLAAKNVIPETVTMGGTYRTYEPEIREMMGRRIQEIAQHVAQAHNCAAEVTLIPMFPSLVNNNAVIDAVYAAGVEQIGEENTIWKGSANMGSEDFAYYTNFTKAGFFYFGIRNDEKGFTNSLHNARFDIDEDTFAPTLSVYAAAVLNLLEMPAWRSKG